MTPKEAISYAAGMLKNGGNKQKQDFVKVVTEALEKQIPKKPKETDWIYCPVCGCALGLWGETKNCPECLQAIDWSEEE